MRSPTKQFISTSNLPRSRPVACHTLPEERTASLKSYNPATRCTRVDCSLVTNHSMIVGHTTASFEVGPSGFNTFDLQWQDTACTSCWQPLLPSAAKQAAESCGPSLSRLKPATNHIKKHMQQYMHVTSKLVTACSNHLPTADGPAAAATARHSRRP
jgi:hypothetical protein